MLCRQWWQMSQFPSVPTDIEPWRLVPMIFLPGAYQRQLLTNLCRALLHSLSSAEVWHKAST